MAYAVQVMETFALLAAVVSVLAALPLFWLALLLRKRYPGVIVSCYLAVQVLLVLFLVVEFAPVFGAPHRVLPSFAFSIRAVLFLLLPAFLHRILLPLDRLRRDLLWGAVALLLLIRVWIGEGLIAGRGLAWPAGLSFSLPYLGLAGYVAWLIVSHLGKLSDRRVRRLLAFFAVLFPVHFLLATANDYAFAWEGAVFPPGWGAPFHACCFLLWNLVFLAFLSRFLELRPIPLVAGASFSLDEAQRGGLSEREREVVDLLLAGCTRPEIADRLCISEFTVKTHIRNIYSKLDVRNRIGLAEFFRKI
jgi:DNA-binding CsgD family transcriptional regulator